MADITMSLDDTLELDTIIESSNRASDPISSIKYEGSSTNDYTSKGIQTHTEVFKPGKPGTYSITVNGQELTVKVTDPNVIPNTQKNYWSLDSGSGSTALDEEGSQDGSISGASWTTDSKTGGYALSF